MLQICLLVILAACGVYANPLIIGNLMNVFENATDLVYVVTDDAGKL
jgi:hypothetical protein